MYSYISNIAIDGNLILFIITSKQKYLGINLIKSSKTLRNQKKKKAKGYLHRNTPHVGRLEELILLKCQFCPHL